MMLLMGMKISLTKKPTNPMTTNPIAVRNATLENSLRSGLWQRLTRRTLSLANSRRGSTTESMASMARSREETRRGARGRREEVDAVGVGTASLLASLFSGWLPL
jgi:hypothetical protein